ncbi:MAG TPA: hypothetical protein PLZ93_06670 [Nocardioides sp.]|uniref:hypothetical protein n=1 Tax=uncultured Nocardioides sp. TaxID=198441 RepID=UPI000EE78D55|nr:hypothetical protein [uncultured Nocardioides sp.]HCB06391.1 hypothetical protein [Nocardioides sp.]HRD59873.1 hypothetical protein [Nocardioides sp.]HRI95276.1 hypothetical protein [Nocardioides sp.]HRK45143.1 hypothetical protein [Nocardioides sp.]
MDELSGRFELLKAEIAELQVAIRSYDVARGQIQGWAVTVGLAAAGLALTAEAPAAVLLGLVAALAFWLLDGQRRSVQQRLIARSIEIESALAAHSIAQVLAPGSGVRIPGLAHHISAQAPAGGRGWRHGSVLREALRPGTWALYAALAGALLTSGVAALR